VEWNNLTFTSGKKESLGAEKTILYLRGTKPWTIKPVAWLLRRLKHPFSFTSR